MAENAAKSGAIGAGSGSGASGNGGGGEDPPRKSNMNGNRSGRFGSDGGAGKGRVNSSSDSADEEAKLLQQGKGGQVVKGVGGTDVDSGGGGAGGEEGAENGDLVKARDGHGVSVIDMADVAGAQSYKPINGKKKNVFKSKYS